MNRFVSSFLTAGLAFNSFATAAPTASTQTFSVEQVKNAKFTRNGAAALAKTYRKYGVSPPQSLVAAASRAKAVHQRSTGSATTTPEDGDSEWLTPVQIGTPAQTFNLDFDTGSSDLWVFCTDASYSANGHAEYNPSNSSTSKKLSGASWSISYGDGSSSSGDVYHDKVTIGGLTVAAQAVEAATTVSSAFSSEANLDGLLGLGFSSINTVKPTQQKTFFDSAASQLGSKVFTADLKHDAGGKYNFGYIDTSAYTGKMTYTDVDSSQGYWGFTSSGYQVGNGSFTSTSISGIADTGTTLLMLPEEVVKAYYAQVSGAQYDSSAGGYVFSCDADLPDFTFGVGSATITIPSAYMNYCSLESESSYGKRSDDGQYTEVIVEQNSDGTATTITTSATGISEADIENLLDGFGGGDSSGFGGSDSSSGGYGGGSSGGSSNGGGFGGSSGSGSGSGSGFGGDSGSPFGTPTAAVPASTPVTTPGYGGGSSSGGSSGGSSGSGSSSNMCYGGLQSSTDIGINIFGDIALKAAFVVFDGASTRLGWAAKSLS